jgi:maleylacetoacetate isomerase
MHRFTLYGFWRSSASHRVRIALHLKGVVYENVPVNLATGEQSKPAHAERSPTRMVPVLEVDRIPYVESMAIIGLLEDLVPKPALLPDSPHGRARVRAVAEIVNAGIQPVQNLRLLSKVSDDADVQDRWLKLLAFEEKALPRGFASLEQALELHAAEGVRGPYAYGSEVTLADLYLVPHVFSARRFGFDTRHFARVISAFEAATALDAFRRAEPANQPDAQADAGPAGART